MAQRRPAILPEPQLDLFLRQLEFPLTRAQLIERALARDLTAPWVRLLGRLPDVRFETLGALARQLGEGRLEGGDL